MNDKNWIKNLIIIDSVSDVTSMIDGECLDKAFKLNFNCLPIEIAQQISYSDRFDNHFPQRRLDIYYKLIYNHLENKFYIVELCKKQYPDHTEGYVKVNIYQADHFEWEDQIWYINNPSYLDFLNHRLSEHSIVITHKSNVGYKGYPNIISVCIIYQNNTNGKISFSGNGFQIEDGFNKAYASMKKIMLGREL